MSVYTKLQAARIALQSTQMKKSGNNKFAGYSYFELGDFLPRVNELFAQSGLFSAVSFNKELATLKIIDTEDGSEVVFTSPMADAQLKGCHPIQNLGAVETYQRRYLYVTALEIVEHDALDSAPPVDNSKGAKAAEAIAKSDAKPTAGAFESMDEQEQNFLRELAVEIVDAVQKRDFAHAVKQIDERHLEQDEKVALWSLLDSKTRSAIKKWKDANATVTQA